MGSPIYRGEQSFKNWILTPRKTRNHPKGGCRWPAMVYSRTKNYFPKFSLIHNDVINQKVVISHQGFVWLFLHVVHFNSSTDNSNTVFTNTQYNLVLLF